MSKKQLILIAVLLVAALTTLLAYSKRDQLITLLMGKLMPEQKEQP